MKIKPGLTLRTLLIVFAMLLPTAVLSQTVEKLSVVTGGVVVGTMTATIDGNEASIDYAVSNNGRGPKHHETMTLGSKGIPTAWTIQGSSVMGAPISEEYSWSNGRARWSSEPDEGDVDDPAHTLYLVSEDSPWVLGVYARALLAAPERKLDILPSGEMSLAKVIETKIGGVRITVYRLDGVQVEPDYVMLDKRGRVFSTFKQAVGGMSALLSVRAGYEDQEPALRSLMRNIELERARALHKQLTHNYDRPVRITNIRIFDPAAGALGDLTTVVFHNGRITRTVANEDDDENVGDGAVIIDGEGGALVPGLADMHIHFKELQSGFMLIAAGVTTARDTGNDNRFTPEIVTRIKSGEIIGPHLFLSGFIEGKSPYSNNAGFVVDSVKEAIEAVRWYADHGYWRVKIYNSMTPEWVKPLAQEAHRLGIGVTGHIPAFTSPDAMILAGYDEITHINQLVLGWVIRDGEDSRTPLRLMAMSRAADLDLNSPKVRKTVELMKTHHTPLDSTASIFEWLMLSRARKMPPTDVAFYDHMPIGFQRAERRTYVRLSEPGDDEAFHKGFEKMLEVIGLLHKNGIQILPGTDNANGFTLHRELALLTQAGMTPAEVLKADTLDVARYFGNTQEHGAIERGKVADLVLVAGDPTADINVMNGPRMVVKAGAVYFPNEMYSAVGIKPFSTAPVVKFPDTPTAE